MDESIFHLPIWQTEVAGEHREFVREIHGEETLAQALPAFQTAAGFEWPTPTDLEAAYRANAVGGVVYVAGLLALERGVSGTAPSALSAWWTGLRSGLVERAEADGARIFPGVADAVETLELDTLLACATVALSQFRMVQTGKLEARGRTPYQAVTEVLLAHVATFPGTNELYQDIGVMVSREIRATVEILAVKEGAEVAAQYEQDLMGWIVPHLHAVMDEEAACHEAVVALEGMLALMTDEHRAAFTASSAITAILAAGLFGLAEWPVVSGYLNDYYTFVGERFSQYAHVDGMFFAWYRPRAQKGG